MFHRAFNCSSGQLCQEFEFRLNLEDFRRKNHIHQEGERHKVEGISYRHPSSKECFLRCQPIQFFSIWATVAVIFRSKKDRLPTSTCKLGMEEEFEWT
jgi:hypothetical protein